MHGGGYRLAGNPIRTVMALGQVPWPLGRWPPTNAPRHCDTGAADPYG